LQIPLVRRLVTSKDGEPCARSREGSFSQVCPSCRRFARCLRRPADYSPPVPFSGGRILSLQDSDFCVAPPHATETPRFFLFFSPSEGFSLGTSSKAAETPIRDQFSKRGTFPLYHGRRSLEGLEGFASQALKRPSWEDELLSRSTFLATIRARFPITPYASVFPPAMRPIFSEKC